MANTTITRAQALQFAIDNIDNDEVKDVLGKMLAQVTKPRKAAVSKARKVNENLANKVVELAGDEVTTKDVVALGLAEITTTQIYAKVTDDKIDADTKVLDSKISERFTIAI